MKLLPLAKCGTESLHELWRDCKHHHCERARELLILHYAGLVKYVLDRLALNPPSPVEFNDLVNTGILGLIDAVDRYDPEYGTPFKSYAICRIRGSILDEAKKLGWIPRSRYRKHVMIEHAYAQIEREMGRPATDEEVARVLDLELEGLYELLADMHSSNFISLYDCIHADAVERGTCLIDIIEDPQVDPAESVELREMQERLADAIRNLLEKEKFVIMLYYYEELTFKEIGRVLSVSESRVCQIHTKAVLRIRGKLRDIMPTER